MKSMFSMGFSQDIFGSRVESPMLGRRVPIRGLGQVSQNGDQLLAQLQQAESQVNAANLYIGNHPNLQQDLGNDFATFQQYMNEIQATANSETNAVGVIQATTGGQQVSLDQQTYNDIQTYIQAAGILAQIIAAHPNASPATASTPATSPVAPAPTTASAAAGAAGAAASPYLVPAQKPGTTPAPKPVVPAPSTGPSTALLVGGGVLAIGVIALLAKGA